jgi:hypothetical protein
LFEALELDADIETGVVEGIMYVDVWAPEGSESVGVLIGRHGHTLDALQELVKATVHHQMGCGAGSWSTWRTIGSDAGKWWPAGPRCGQACLEDRQARTSRTDGSL